jgi:hypothetical protein
MTICKLQQSKLADSLRGAQRTMADDPAESPEPERHASLRALAENPTVRPSVRVAARKLLRKERQAQQETAGSGRGSGKPNRKLN